MSVYKVAVMVGSLRQDSINKKLALALEKLAGPDLIFHYVKLDDLPLFNADLESSLPAPVVRLKSELKNADGILFVTPEHNRSLPAALKNAIDWASRPYGKNSWQDKPVAISGTSPGGVGSALAQLHLRQVLAPVGANVLGGHEMYLQFTQGILNDQGEIIAEGSIQHFKKILTDFSAFIARFK